MDPIQLIVLFTGLCGFVPEHPVTPHRPNKVHVLLVNAEGIYPPHTATLVIREKFFKGGVPSRCELIDLDPQHAPGERFFRCDLRDAEKIRFEPEDEDCQRFGCVDIISGLVGRSDDPECPTQDNREDFYWIGSMDRITRGLGKVRRDALWTPEDVTHLVKASFLFSEGRLSVRDFSRVKPATKRAKEASNPRYSLPKFEFLALGQQHPRDIIKWEIDRPGADFDQAFADLVEIKKGIPENTEPVIVLEHKNADGVITKDQIPLDTSKGTIYVEVKNLPEKYLCKDNPSPTSPDDLHFRHLYSLLVEDPGLENLEADHWCEPVVENDYPLCAPSQSRLNDPQCPVAAFTPNF